MYHPPPPFGDRSASVAALGSPPSTHLGYLLSRYFLALSSFHGSSRRTEWERRGGRLLCGVLCSVDDLLSSAPSTFVPAPHHRVVSFVPQSSLSSTRRSTNLRFRACVTHLQSNLLLLLALPTLLLALLPTLGEILVLQTCVCAGREERGEERREERKERNPTPSLDERRGGVRSRRGLPEHWVDLPSTAARYLTKMRWRGKGKGSNGNRRDGARRRLGKGDERGTNSRDASEF